MSLATTDIEELASALLALPLSSRAFLAETLVESVDNYASPEIARAWQREINRRLQEYEEGRAEGIPSEEVFAEARARLNEARQISSRGAG
ncbi:MAG: addiction module protein [Armatimonadetes bacterium]|nr:addiction module protein [Armatimonadota bacterium]